MRCLLTLSVLLAPLVGAAAQPSTGTLRLELQRSDGSRMPSSEWLAFFSQSDHGVPRADTLDPILAKHSAQGLVLVAQEKADLAASLKTRIDEWLITPASTLTRALSLTPPN